MIKIGIIAGGALRVVGIIAEVKVAATGEIIARIADTLNHKVFGKTTRSKVKKIRKSINSTTKVVASTTEVVVDKTVEIGTYVTGYALKKAGKVLSKAFVKEEIKIYGDSSNFYDKEKLVKVNYEVVNGGK
jgi:hypothetical protein